MDQTVTITFNIGTVLTWIIIGLIAGFLAGVIVRGRRFGFLTSVIVGLIGAIIGGFIFTIIRIPVPAALNAPINIRWIDILVAFIGAVILLLILGLFYRYRRPIV
jgi:uncharacterized membrane protein YeaQ/YmgE (transglycosylase-associated protein family)